MKIKLFIIALFLFVCTVKGYAGYPGIFQTSSIEAHSLTISSTALTSSTMSWTSCDWVLARTTATAVTGALSYDVQVGSAQTSAEGNRFTIKAGEDPVLIPFNGAIYAIANSTNNTKIQFLIGK